MNIPFSEIEPVLNSDEDIGFCLDCGCSQPGCEPDARNRDCDSCGSDQVFGAQEVVMMGRVDDTK